MSRIQLQDNLISAITKMAEGNMGAMTAMMEIIKIAPEVDPNAFMGGLGSILLMDTFEIYGTDIYVLWSDICERNTVKMLAVLRATQLGLFSSKTLKDASNRQDYSGKNLVPVDELYQKVKEKLPEFDAGSTVV